MKKLIAEVWKHPHGFLSAMFYCHDADGQLDRAITHTLLSLIEESAPPSDAELEALVAEAEGGHYIPRDPSLPDWGVNDKNVWLVPPMAKPGNVCISNENTGEYSTEEGGQPQQFTYEQFRAALKHWREFRELMAREGKDKLVGRRYEVVFPE
jgi:hypothetical protein